MSKYLKGLIAGVALSIMPVTAQAQDADAGAKVFKKCQACHAVGEGAGNKVGPHLNDLFGRAAAGADGYNYSNAMKKAGEDGLTWNDQTLTEFLANPRQSVKGTKMAFGGLRKDEELANVIAYLKTFSAGAVEAEPKAESEGEGAGDQAAGESDASGEQQVAMLAKDAPVPDHGNFHLGREALPEEITAWDIDIRPDGMGLPEGSGTVAEGEVLYTEQCSACHGVFGEGAGRWPVLAGGQDTLTDERPEKTIGSYWPYLSTVYDYVRRAMPFGNARSLSDDDVYAITAYLMYLNDIVTEEDFELSNENFTEVQMPNVENFFFDDRDSEAHYAEKPEPCMSDCKPGPVEITMRARILDVTPGSDSEEDGSGSIE